MKRRSLWIYLALPLLLSAISLSTARAGVVVFLDKDGTLTAVQDPAIADPPTALSILAAGPSAVWGAGGLQSALPLGSKLRDFRTAGRQAIVDYSAPIMHGQLGDAQLEAMFDQVQFTLRQFGWNADVVLLINGQPASDYVMPAPRITARPAGDSVGIASLTTGSLSGTSITLSPGHGRLWNGSAWGFQRSPTCSGALSREDDHNLEMSIYLKTYLENEGMTVKVPRCQDKNYGNHSSGVPWWQMASVYWLYNLGYPCSVYGSTTDCTPGSGANEWNDDIRARPLASDYDNTTIYFSLHTNALSGDCTGPTCPTGSDMYYDCSAEHASWCTVSLSLANAINTAVNDSIHNRMPDSDWNNRGVHDSNGAYGEIRIPDRAACLFELGFHDTCDHDAVHLQDNFFRSAAMWGIYKGICDYFAVTPTWDFYSDDLVSHDIPASMYYGEVRTVHITYRNKGVLWNQTRAFKLGAVGDSDPFTGTTRYDVTSEIVPEDTVTFTLTLTAPSTPGSYTTDWRMLREGVTWFGATCSQVVQVGANPDTEPPTVPTGLTATVMSQTQVDLSWNASTDNVGVTGYKVFRNGGQIGTSATTSYSDTTCQAATTYSYQVSAYDGAGNNSALCAAVVVTTPPIIEIIVDNPSATFTGTWSTGTYAGKYGADYRFKDTAFSETATCTWTPNLSASGYYDVYVWYLAGANRSIRAPYTVAYNGGSQTYQVDQTINSAQWFFLGTKLFSSGTSGYIRLSNFTSETGKVVIADAVRFYYKGSSDSQPPTAPTNLSATAVSPTQVNLSWTASTDNIGVAGYKVYRNSAQIGTSATTSYSDTTCSPSTTYTYEVSAYDDAQNESPKSNSAVVTTPAATAEYIIDNPAATYTGTWSTGTSSTDKYGTNYRYAGTVTTENATARWTPNIDIAGNFDVYVWYPQGANRSIKAPHTVYWNGGSQTVQVNQTTNGGRWNLIVSNKSFAAGTGGYVKLGNGTAESGKVVMADAVRFVRR